MTSRFWLLLASKGLTFRINKTGRKGPVLLIGETRFELATSASRTQRSVQAELLPAEFQTSQYTLLYRQLQTTLN